MLLTVSQLTLAFGPRTLFRDAGFVLGPRDRTGLVGPNGSGKTTLLRILNHEMEADRLTLEKRTDTTFGYLPQENIVLSDRSVITEVEAAAEGITTVKAHLEQAEDELQSLAPESAEFAECVERLSHYSNRLQELEAHKLRSRAEKILFGLGFRESDMERPCGEFSGGWQMRIALARLLLSEPEILMLDEPTNHLDLESLRWLESFLKDYPGSILLISHDRALLDQLCSSILSLERGTIVAYTGNYASFLTQREERMEQLELARKSQDRKIAQTERFIERFRYKASKASQVQSRIKQLEKVERIETETADKAIAFEFPLSRRSGERVLTLEGLHKAYGPATVFNGLTLEIGKGDRIGVVGLNGAGKSTLARIIANREPYEKGRVDLGHNVDLGYFAQDQSTEFDSGQTVFQIASAPPVRATETRIRSVLGAFLFTGDDAEKPVRVLSGGEKNRLALARLLLYPANFLVLDEPTNHLDMTSKEVLQAALKEFPGTTFIVSHDRHFLNPVVNKVLEIQPGKARLLPGNLEDYMWKVDREKASTTRKEPEAEQPRSTENPRERRRRQAALQQKLSPLKQKLAARESEIAGLEERIAEREERMLEKAFFERGERTAAEVREYESWKGRLASAMEEWENTAARIEEIENVSE